MGKIRSVITKINGISFVAIGITDPREAHEHYQRQGIFVGELGRPKNQKGRIVQEAALIRDGRKIGTIEIIS